MSHLRPSNPSYLERGWELIENKESQYTFRKYIDPYDSGLAEIPGFPEYGFKLETDFSIVFSVPKKTEINNFLFKKGRRKYHLDWLEVRDKGKGESLSSILYQIGKGPGYMMSKVDRVERLRPEQSSAMIKMIEKEIKDFPESVTITKEIRKSGIKKIKKKIISEMNDFKYLKKFVDV